MSEKIYHINKNNIFVKIMKYIWNLDHHDFSHMCPFFWLSLANIFIIVPYFCICKALLAIKVSGSYIIDLLDAYFEELDKKATEKEIARYQELSKNNFKNVTISREKIRTLEKKIYKYDLESKIETRSDQFINSLFRTYWDKENEKERLKRAKKHERERELEEARRLSRINKFKSIYEKKLSSDEIEHIIFTNSYESYIREYEQDKERIAREKMIANKVKINKMIEVIKPIFTWLAYTLGGFVTLFIGYWLVIWTGSFIEWFSELDFTLYEKAKQAIKQSLAVTGIIVLIGGIVILLSYLIIEGIKNNSFSISINIPTPVINFFSSVWNFILVLLKGIAYPFKQIGNLISFLITMVKDECPPIKWED